MSKAICIKETAIAAARCLGYSEMKLQQLQVVEAFVKGHDGKSLCYACLPLVFDKLPQGSIVLVVSPLIAIMKDQV